MSPRSMRAPGSMRQKPVGALAEAFQTRRGAGLTAKSSATDAPSKTRPTTPASRLELRRRGRPARGGCHSRSEEHTSELQSLMRISYAVFCLKKKSNTITTITTEHTQTHAYDM